MIEPSLKHQQQIKLPSIGLIGQMRLQQAKVIIFGAGGLAATCFPYLVNSGIGQITLVDFDTVSESNLHRQILFTDQDIGLKKAQCLATWAKKSEPTCQVTPIDTHLTGLNLLNIISNHDVIVDCTDDFQFSLQLNKIACTTAKPIVFGNAIALQGQMLVFSGSDHDACLCCVWGATAPAQAATCAGTGVLGPVPGNVGCLQALATIKLIVNVDKTSTDVNQLFYFDFEWMNFRRMKVKRAETCLHHQLSWAQLTDELAQEDHLIFDQPIDIALKQGKMVIDICDPEERTSVLHFAHQIIPMSRLMQEPNKFIDKNQSYILVCKIGRRSQTCASYLRSQGFMNVCAYPKAPI